MRSDSSSRNPSCACASCCLSYTYAGHGWILRLLSFLAVSLGLQCKTWLWEVDLINLAISSHRSPGRTLTPAIGLCFTTTSVPCPQILTCSRLSKVTRSHAQPCRYATSTPPAPIGGPWHKPHKVPGQGYHFTLFWLDRSARAQRAAGQGGDAGSLHGATHLIDGESRHAS